MGEIKRAANPFRFEIPEELARKLHSMCTRQTDGDLMESEEAVLIYGGMGCAEFLTMDGRILVD